MLALWIIGGLFSAIVLNFDGQRPEFSADRSGGGDSPRATIEGGTGEPCGGWLVAVAANSGGSHRVERCCG